MKKIDLYLRVSTQEQKLKKNSTEAQLNRLTNYYKECDIQKTYDADVGRSATISDDKIDISVVDNRLIASFDLKKRPAMISLCEDAKGGLCAPELLIWKWDRFSRNSMFQELLLIYLKRFGVSVIPTDDSKEPVVRRVMGAFNQEEPEKTKERIILVQKDKVTQGKVLNRPPFGYKFNSKKELVVDNRRAQIVRGIFELKAEGGEIKSIAERFDLTKNFVYRVLKNPTYIGKSVYAKKVYIGNHEKIISDELFDKANLQ